MSEDGATCEVKFKGQWISRTIDEALGLHRERELRCSECHGRVRAHCQAADALLDANVLYPAPMRDLLIEVARTDLFKAKWSADIHR